MRGERRGRDNGGRGNRGGMVEDGGGRRRRKKEKEGGKRIEKIQEKMGGCKGERTRGRSLKRDRVRREREKREKERGMEIQKRKERRKNLVWKGVEGGSEEERKRVMEGIITEELGREAEISEVRERKGAAGKVLIVKMGKWKDRIELLEKGWEIRRNWGVGIDEDLTMEERRVRWRLIERARLERAKGNVVVTINRRIWVNGKAWGWDNERNMWQENLAETEGESED